MINQQEIRNVRGYVVGASLLATLATLGGCAPEEVATDMRVQAVLTISTIKNDLEWKDTTPTGLPIVAQAGSILRDSDGTFYWYGTRANKIFTSGSPNTSAPPLGIGVYSSTNLVDWKDEGLIAAASSNAGRGEARLRFLRSPISHQDRQQVHHGFKTCRSQILHGVESNRPVYRKVVSHCIHP